MVYQWILLTHVVGALLFMLSHGASASISLRLRIERNPERVGALLDLSKASYNLGMLALVIVLGTGITMGVLGGWWQRGWFWTSLILFLGIAFAMTPMAATPYNRVRQALGLTVPQAFIARRMEAPERPPTPEELEELLSGPYPVASTLLGVVGIAILVYLMMFKPF